MRAKRLVKNDIGRFVRVEFDCSGATDGIITKIDGPTDFRFLPLHSLEGVDIHNNDAPISAIGRHVTAEHSGLK